MEEILKPIDIKELEAGLEKKLTNSHKSAYCSSLYIWYKWELVSKNLRPAYTNALEFQGYLNGRGYYDEEGNIVNLESHHPYFGLSEFSNERGKSLPEYLLTERWCYKLKV